MKIWIIMKRTNIIKLILLLLLSPISIACHNKVEPAGNSESIQVNGEASSEQEEKVNAVKIGNQLWMAEDLNIDKFNNGDPIPEAKNLDEWKKAGKAGTPMSCYYNFDPENGKKYGKLYNWYAVNDSRGLAPNGFHVATKDDWQELINFTNKPDRREAANSLKSTTDWPEHPWYKGTNGYGFSAKPGGVLSYSLEITAASAEGQANTYSPPIPPIDRCKFHDLGFAVSWWTSSIDGDAPIHANIFRIWQGDALTTSDISYLYDKFCGFYVRCISDKRPFE